MTCKKNTRIILILHIRWRKAKKVGVVLISIKILSAHLWKENKVKMLKKNRKKKKIKIIIKSACLGEIVKFKFIKLIASQ